MCIGNHDFDRSLDDKGELQKAREDYYNFAKEYANEYSIISKGSFYNISKFNEEIAYISLDSTYQRNGNVPGKLTEEDINKFIADLQTNRINNFEAVIIGSHYPLIHFPNYPFPELEGWYDAHFWKSGSFLRVRLEEVLNMARKIWLFGDTHQPGSWSYNSSTYVMSGRFGTKILKIEKDNIDYLTNLNRQASIVSISNKSISSEIIQFYSLEHQESSLRGKWGLGHSEKSNFNLIRPEIINLNIEKNIITDIVEKRLYRFGRFSTNDEYDILGWIFINDLLNSHSLISSIITSCKEDWIDKKRLTENGESLIVGVDYWGGIIAAHLSVLTGLKNLPVPSKNNLQHYTNAELLEQNKSLFEKEYENLIIILDVLNTGKTLLKLIGELKLMLKLIDKCKINCISIISNVNQSKDKGLMELNSIGTFCGELQQPVVPKDFLPPESILERKEYFKD